MGVLLLLKMVNLFIIGVSEIQYSCCGVHGKVKPKTQDVLQQELSPFEEKIGDDLNGPRILSKKILIFMSPLFGQ